MRQLEGQGGLPRADLPDPVEDGADAPGARQERVEQGQVQRQPACDRPRMELGPHRDQLRRGLVECEHEHGLAPRLDAWRLLVDFHGSSSRTATLVCDLRSELAQGGVSSPKRRVGFLALAAATAAGALLTGASAGSTGGASTLRTPAFFISSCGFSHRASDDPIVYPGGGRGCSHNHTFVGNVSTNAFSTLASLRRPGRRASRGRHGRLLGADALRDGKPVHADRRDDLLPPSDDEPVKPFPAGLRMVAGNSRAWRRRARA